MCVCVCKYNSLITAKIMYTHVLRETRYVTLLYGSSRRYILIIEYMKSIPEFRFLESLQVFFDIRFFI